MKNKDFRYDINGLRAIAILAVVLYHFGMFGFSSGFVGVDIFFVISGYLMTKILYSDSLNFCSIFKFYHARAIRIIPALLVMIFILLPILSVILIPDFYSEFIKHAIRSLFFISNYTYMNEGLSYFSSNSKYNVLLHTWSLSTEWQFYLLYPFVFYFANKYRRFTIYILLLIFIISLSLSSVLYLKYPVFSYFMIPTRAWEMVLGGLVYLSPFKFSTVKPKSKFLYHIFVFLLVISCFLFNESTPWPSYNALLPCLLTSIILLYNYQNSILKNGFLQLIGLSSYSIYLWHWPLYVIMKCFNITSKNISLFFVFLSFLIGYISFKAVEVLLSSYLKKLSKAMSSLIIVMFIALFYLLFHSTGNKMISGLFINHRNYTVVSSKMELPLPENGNCFYSIDTIHNLPFGAAGLDCHIGSSLPNAKKVLLFGDSFAGQYIPFWREIGVKLNLNIQVVTTNWCYPSFGRDFNGRKDSIAYKQCLFNREFFRKKFSSYSLIVLGGQWSRVLNKDEFRIGFLDSLKSISKNRKVIVMPEPYSFDVNIGRLYEQSVWLNSNFELSSYLNNPLHCNQLVIDKELDSETEGNKNIFIISRGALFKSSQYAYGNFPYSWDGQHINYIGSMEAADVFSKSILFNDFNKFIN